MAIIKVDPDLLDSSSLKLSDLKNRVAGLGGELMKISSSAPLYQGQFSPKVLGLGAQAHLKVLSQSGKADSQANHLSKIAKRFRDADSGYGGSNGWTEAFKNFLDKVGDFFGGLSPWVIGQLGVLGSLGSLFFPPMPWNPTPVYGSDGSGTEIPRSKIKVFFDKIRGSIVEIYRKLFPKREAQIEYVSRKPVDPANLSETPSSIPIPSTPPTSTTFPNDAGESVKPNLGGPAEFGYNPYGSNCTWFAAQAVFHVSGGKFVPDWWGNARQWKAKAELMAAEPNSFVEGVDKTPRAGDVIVFKFGHVAYVEKVVGGQITFVEENYDMDESGWPQAITIIHENGQQLRRWRVTTSVDTVVNNKDYDAYFIHFNYE